MRRSDWAMHVSRTNKVKQMEELRKPRIVLAGLVSVAICGFLLYKFWAGPSVADLADRTTGCMASGNVKCIFDSILDREKKALALTPEKLSALLQNYILPSYEELKNAPEKRVLNIPDQGQVQVAWTWPSSRGGTMMFATTAVATPEGARTICTTQWMIYHAIEAKYRRSPKEETVLLYFRGLERDNAYLSKLGIPGIYDTANDRVIEWKDVISHMRSGLIRAGLLKVINY